MIYLDESVKNSTIEIGNHRYERVGRRLAVRTYKR